MLKRIIQSSLRRFGYRIVPRDRDALTIYEMIRSIPFKTIVDVGANSGSTVERWLADFPTAHIHAIEPLPQEFAKLKTLESRCGGRMSAWNVAASDRSEEIPFYIHTDHPSSSSTLRATSYSKKALPFTNCERLEKVQAMPLDKLFSDNGANLEGPILLKLDVQGVEDRVLNGSSRLLAKTTVVIAEVSVVPLYEGQCTFKSIFDNLLECGFLFRGILEQVHLNDGTPVYFDAVFTKS